jgi:HSP20 family protein
MNELAKITRWNPFKEFEDLQNQMRSLFALTGNGGPGLLPGGDEFADWSPAVDVSEDEKEYTITADLPNVEKSDIKVTQDNGMLTISGERRREQEEHKKTWHRIERSYGKYVRSFQLPEEIDQKKIAAAFNNGVLKIFLPKADGKKAKKLSGTEIPVK